MRFALDPDQQGFGDARLADARLTREQHNATLTGFGLIPPAQQQVHLLLATNKWGERASAPRVEPTDASRLTAHLPRLQRLRQFVALVGGKRAAVEHGTHQAPRAGRNNDLARRCHGLQLGRQVRRLADRDALSRVATPLLLANNDQPGGYTDARPQRHRGRGLQRADRIEDGDAGAHRLLGVVFMS